jgi:hypothetical protein
MCRLVVSCILALGFAAGHIDSAEGDKIDVTRAEQYFSEVRSQCELDGGRLWGVSLCAPMLFIHPETRQVVANMQDSAGLLNRQRNVFTGSWPRNLAIANSSQVWNGTKWSTIMWPPPDDRVARLSLLMHESFHSIQQKIGFPPHSPSNSHLDTRDGRLWLQLEWRALKSALIANESERRTAIADALTFRAFRRTLFPDAAESERLMEMHEGLAEYTGIRLCGLPKKDIPAYFSDQVYEVRLKAPSFVGSFAYVSGAAYGLLLDVLDADWRAGLTPDRDFGDLLRQVSNTELPLNLDSVARDRMIAYGGKELEAQEIERENEHNRIVADYRARLIDGPVLVLPLVKMNMQFDPRNMVSLDSLGNVYPTIRIVDEWGILTVTRGALIAASWSKVQVPAPTEIASRPLRGDGWSLELNDGWEVAKCERLGDYTIQKAVQAPADQTGRKQ